MPRGSRAGTAPPRRRRPSVCGWCGCCRRPGALLTRRGRASRAKAGRGSHCPGRRPHPPQQSGAQAVGAGGAEGAGSPSIGVLRCRRLHCPSTQRHGFTRIPLSFPGGNFYCCFLLQERSQLDSFPCMCTQPWWDRGRVDAGRQRKGNGAAEASSIHTTVLLFPRLPSPGLMERVVPLCRPGLTASGHGVRIGSPSWGEGTSVTGDESHLRYIGKAAVHFAYGCSGYF